MQYTKSLADISYDVEVDGDGEICIETVGYNNEAMPRYFDIETLEKILEAAKAHKAAYEQYKANDYTDMPEVGDIVVSNVGRNAGERGTVVEVKPNQVLIAYGREITLPDGNKVTDIYWSDIKDLQINHE